MKKLLLVCFAMLAFCLPSFGQAYTVVTATNVLVDSSGSAVHPPSGSTLCFLGTNGATQPVTYTPSGGSSISGPVCQTLNGSGALTGSLQLANGATATPAPLFYTATIANGSTVYLTLPLMQIQGGVFSFDSYKVTATSTSTGTGLPHIGCIPGAKFTSTTLNPSGFTCNLINGVGAWVTYPATNYCGNGQALVVGQGTGQNFCLSPQISGLGSPSGSCIEHSTYFQLDSAPGNFFWGCVNAAWQQSSGGGGGGSGLTSFQGRTTAAATLQVSDLTGLLANAPFGLSGSHGIVTDTGAGTFAPNANWGISTGGALEGSGDFSILTAPAGSTVYSINHSNGAFSAAAGSFNVGASGATRWGGGADISSTDVVCQSDGTHCPGAASLFYQTVQSSNITLTSRPKMNFLGSTGVSAADDPTNTSTDVALLQASASQYGAAKCDGVTIICTGGVMSLENFHINSFACGACTTVELGATVTNPAFTASYSSTPTSAAITNTDGISSPTNLTTPFTSGTVTGSFTHTSATTTTFTLTAIATSTKTATQVISWSPRTFYGVGTTGATGATASGNNAVLVGATGTLGTWGLGTNTGTVSVSPSSQYVYILLSTSGHTFSVNGFGTSFSVSTITFTNQYGVAVTMYLYRSPTFLSGTYTVGVS